MLEPGLILPQLVARRAATHPDRTYLEMIGGETLRYGEVHARVQRLAAALAGVGAERGTAVVSMLPISPESVIAWLGCGWLGALQTPINADYRGTLLAHALELTTPPIGIGDAPAPHGSRSLESRRCGHSFWPGPGRL